MKHYFYKYLSESDTCQLESAYEKKKRMYNFEKQRTVTNKQSMIKRKVLFTLIDDYFMYEDLHLFIK